MTYLHDIKRNNYLVLMTVYTTEIASAYLASDNPIHQRLLKPYILCKENIHGRLLELGCGEGRGVELVKPHVLSYQGIDKIARVIHGLSLKYKDCVFTQMHFPPLAGIADNSFDSVISFQVIEHIRDDRRFIAEIYRVLKPGGVALITTPNRKMSLTRNPWHVREYLSGELERLCRYYFTEVNLMGISGNEKVMSYYEANRASVRKFTRFDLLNLQYRLPSVLLRLPYDWLNRINRNRLKTSDHHLVHQISHEDYLLSSDPDESLDLFCILYKK